MRLVKSSYDILEQPVGLDGIYSQIERAGRTCYKSEDKITPDSAQNFVDRMISSGHGAMLEHGTVYLEFPVGFKSRGSSLILEEYGQNPYSKVVMDGRGWAVTTNLRVMVENNWLEDLKYLCEPTEWHRQRVSVRFICDRGVSHELVRHRSLSFAQESTRYCNYGKDKFGNEVTFIVPSWIVDEKQINMSLEKRDLVGNNIQELTWKLALCETEEVYLNLLSGKYGKAWTPQQARSVLPNALKTEIVVTGYRGNEKNFPGAFSGWKHFFELRDSERAHPDMYALAHPLHKEFIKRGWV